MLITFSIRNSKETVDLFIFTEEIPNEKLFCAVNGKRDQYLLCLDGFDFFVGLLCSFQCTLTFLTVSLLSI